jgi:hypothetical protein
MIRDLALAAKASCSLEDQESLVPLVVQLKRLSELVSKQGLLALENELLQIKDTFLNLGVQLIIDKVEPENIKDILDSDIYYNQSNGRGVVEKNHYPGRIAAHPGGRHPKKRSHLHKSLPCQSRRRDVPKSTMMP